MSKGMQTMTNPLYNKHVISISDLTRSDMELVVATAQRLKAEPDSRLLKDKLVASCFFEASTRTRLSFETAVQRLGGNIIGFADGGNTSAKKGETLADSIKIIGSTRCGGDAPPRGRRPPRLRVLRVPVINGGDGSNQHPTQTLLDLFSIHETQGRLDGLNVASSATLKYGRTVLPGPGPEPVQLPLLHLPEALAMPGLPVRGAGGEEHSVQRARDHGRGDAGARHPLHDPGPEGGFDETEYKHMAAKFVLELATLEGGPTMKILHPPCPGSTRRRGSRSMRARLCWHWY